MEAARGSLPEEWRKDRSIFRRSLSVLAIFHFVRSVASGARVCFKLRSLLAAASCVTGRSSDGSSCSAAGGSASTYQLPHAFSHRG
jgi:hypothetical protein